MTTDGRPPLLVLGLGNLLLQDDAVGLSLLAALQEQFAFEGAIEFVDGGTQGLSLLPRLSGRRAVLLLDAIADGSAPGTVHHLPDALARAGAVSGGKSGGAHHANAGDLLLAARLLGELPARVVAVGVEPLHLHTGIGLSDQVLQAMPAALRLAGEQLRALLAAEAAACTN